MPPRPCPDLSQILASGRAQGTAVSDGCGGAFVVWADDRAISVQRLDSTGTIAAGWPAPGILGLGFDRQPMRAVDDVAQERVSRSDRPSTTSAAEIAPPLAFAFGQAVPTPFERSTQLSFNLPTTSRIRIESYDVHGREVRGALSEELGPGRYQRTWEAVDESGRTLSPGTYLVRIEASAVSGSQRFTMVRKLLLMR